MSLADLKGSFIEVNSGESFYGDGVFISITSGHGLQKGDSLNINRGHGDYRNGGDILKIQEQAMKKHQVVCHFQQRMMAKNQQVEKYL